MTTKDEASAAELDRYGIVRVPADTFVWNGYRYTHVRDALAAAKREAAK
jgi:cystathionine beta-lyase family protein involved in aluminum resistance